MRTYYSFPKYALTMLFFLAMTQVNFIHAQELPGIKVDVNGNVGIGTPTPIPSAKLQVNSTSKGVLIPRMTWTQMQAITPKVEGLIAYRYEGTSDLNGPYYWSETEVDWIRMDGSNITWIDIGGDQNDLNFWLLNGNNNTDVNSFLGTNNTDPLRIGAGTNEVITVEHDGRVQIGTDVLGASLELQGHMVQKYPNQLKNIVIGTNAGNTNMAPNGDKTAEQNILMGEMAGFSLTDGDNNNFFGFHAGRNSTQARGNNYIGRGAGRDNQNGFANNYIGWLAGLTSVSGSHNNFLGAQAGMNSTSSYNNAIGSFSGISNTKVHNNYIGFNAGRFDTLGSYNNIIGHSSGLNNQGQFNNIMGYQAGQSANTGNNNNFLGTYAGRNNSSGATNNFIGYFAGDKNTTGSNNNFIGSSVGVNNKTGFRNNYIGHHCGSLVTYAHNNNFIGTLAGWSADSTGYSNFIGYEAGQNHASGDYNTLIGFRAGKNGSGINNNLIGTNAGDNNKGSYNVAIGNQALRNATGIHNIALGSGALKLYQTSAAGDNGFNIAIGGSALGLGASQGRNIGVGWKSLQNNNGYENVSIGYFSASSATGDGNVAIGAHAGKVSTGNGIFIGHGAGAGESGSHKLYIENSTSSTPLIYGEFDNDRLRVNGTLEVANRLGTPNTGAAFDANGQLVETELITPDDLLQAWQLGGNTLTAEQTFGTNSAHDIPFVVNTVERMRIDQVGRMIPQFGTPYSGNIVMGFFAGKDDLAGSGNTVVGEFSGMGMEGGGNSYYGRLAGWGSTGDFNTYIGNQAGSFGIESDSNVMLGVKAGFHSVATSLGTKNVFMGAEAGAGNAAATPYKTVLLGAGTNYSGGSSSDITNSVVIGADGIVNESHTIYLHTGSPNGSIIGDVDFGEPSDSRFKSFVTDDVPGLDMVLGLRPVNYKFDYKNYMSHISQSLSKGERSNKLNGLENATERSPSRSGFIAQEVDNLVKSLNYDFGGIKEPDPKNSSSHYSINYSKFVVPLVKAVQEQQDMIKARDKQIDDMQKQLTEQANIFSDLRKELENLKSQVSTLKN